MTIKQIKEKILNWTDFYGGDIIDREEVKTAKTKKELTDSLHHHKRFLENQNIDAISHLEEFEKELGLY